MRTPIKLSDNITNILTERIADEYNASYHYQGLSNWCAGVGYKKAAQFFAEESKTELDHAGILQKFLVDWNVIVKLPPIPKPQVEYKTLVEGIEASYDIELDLYNKYEANSKEIFELGDICAFDLLQPLRKIQNDSVAEYSDMLNMLDGANTDKTSLLLLEDKIFS